MAEVVRNITQNPTFSTLSTVCAGASRDEECRLRPPAVRPGPNIDSDTTDTAFAYLQEQPLPDRKHRKSVAFSGDNTIMDENGEISEAPPSGSEDKVTAEKHSS